MAVTMSSPLTTPLFNPRVLTQGPYREAIRREIEPALLGRCRGEGPPRKLAFPHDEVWRRQRGVRRGRCCVQSYGHGHRWGGCGVGDVGGVTDNLICCPPCSRPVRSRTSSALRSPAAGGPERPVGHGRADPCPGYRELGKQLEARLPAWSGARRPGSGRGLGCHDCPYMTTVPVWQACEGPAGSDRWRLQYRSSRWSCHLPERLPLGSSKQGAHDADSSRGSSDT